MLYDVHVNPAKHKQAQGRVIRIASAHPHVDLYELKPPTEVEDRIATWQRFVTKTALARDTIEASNTGIADVAPLARSFADPPVSGGVLVVEPLAPPVSRAARILENERANAALTTAVRGLPVGATAVILGLVSDPVVIFTAASATGRLRLAAAGLPDTARPLRADEQTLTIGNAAFDRAGAGQAQQIVLPDPARLIVDADLDACIDLK